MDKPGFIATLLVLCIVLSSSDAAMMFNVHKLVSTEQGDSSNGSLVSPKGNSATASNNQSSIPAANPGNPEKEKLEEPQISNQTNKSSTDSSVVLRQKHNISTSQPSGVEIGDDAEKGYEICKGSLGSCRAKEMIACLKMWPDDSKKLQLVVQNEGNSSLNVDVKYPDSLGNALPAFEVPKNQTKRVDASSAVTKSTQLVLNSGSEKCVIHYFRPAAADNFIQQFSSYSKHVTPIYAAFAFFLFAILFGGTWTCLKFRKKKDKFQYHELEITSIEPSTAVNIDTAEGWDHDWDDDDWDEESSAPAPGVSADDPVLRSFKKD